MEKTSMTVLLGEAPRVVSGYAFDPDSFTTQQISAAIDVDPRYLNRRFWCMNVFDEPQAPTGHGYFQFPMTEAIALLRKKRFPNFRIVCVGRRVAAVMEQMLEIDSIPENQFKTFLPPGRSFEWMLGYIPHPAGLRNSQREPDELVLSRETQDFLRDAASLR